MNATSSVQPSFTQWDSCAARSAITSTRRTHRGWAYPTRGYGCVPPSVRQYTQIRSMRMARLIPPRRPRVPMVPSTSAVAVDVHRGADGLDSTRCVRVRAFAGHPPGSRTSPPRAETELAGEPGAVRCDRDERPHENQPESHGRPEQRACQGAAFWFPGTFPPGSASIVQNEGAPYCGTYGRERRDRRRRSLGRDGGRKCVQRQVEREHVDDRLSEEPPLPPAGVLGEQAPDSRLGQPADAGDARHLVARGRRADVRVEPAAGRGHEVDRNRSGVPG